MTLQTCELIEDEVDIAHFFLEPTELGLGATL